MFLNLNIYLTIKFSTCKITAKLLSKI